MRFCSRTACQVSVRAVFSNLALSPELLSSPALEKRLYFKLVEVARVAQILVVEDEREIRELIALHLRRDGHALLEAESAEEARELLATERIDLALIDWMLPGESGISLVKHLRSLPNHSTGILVVTAKTEPADIIEALESGADDYLTKPFQSGVLVARARAILRRQLLPETRPVAIPSDVLRAGEIELDLVRFEAKVSGELIQLTASEFKMLAVLMKNLGRVFTREALINEIQGEDVTVIGRSIDTHVFGLRKKLGESSDIVETVRGIGYRVRER